MKKVISVILVFSFIAIFFNSASANESFPEAVPVIETNNDGYIDVDLNVEDTTGQDSEDGLQKALNLPASYSSADYGYVTSVKDQRDASACWAFTTISVLESDVIKNFSSATASNTSFSPYHLAWFTYTPPKSTDDRHYGEHYNVSTSSPYTIGGNWRRAAATLANFRGIANNNSVPENQVLDESLRYSTDSGYVLKDAVILESTDEVKNWIMNHGGCYISYHHDSKYLDTSNGAYYNNEKSTQNHAITVVGWDDNYSKTNFKNQPSSNGAWYCKNSFGTSYTPKGYIWISYEDASIDMSKTFYGFSAQKNVYSHNYSYNNAAHGASLKFTDEITSANVFKAEADEKLTAVMIQTLNRDLTAEISVFTDIPEQETLPDEGTLKYEYTTSVVGKGYHTIMFDEAVEIKKGTRFSVIVTLYGNGSINLPIEKNDSSSFSYTGNYGESFLYFNDQWYDCRDVSRGTTAKEDFRNVYISALAQDEKSAHVHSMTVDEKAATCKTTGHRKVYCQTCDYVESYEEYALLPHNFTVIEEKPATCTEKGYKKVSCKNCGQLKSNEEYAKLSHSFSKVITAPTCTEKGFTTFTCSCGYSYVGDYTQAHGHEFERGKVISENIKQTVYETNCKHCDAKSTETQARSFWQRIAYFFTHLFK